MSQTRSASARSQRYGQAAHPRRTHRQRQLRGRRWLQTSGELARARTRACPRRPRAAELDRRAQAPAARGQLPATHPHRPRRSPRRLFPDERGGPQPDEHCPAASPQAPVGGAPRGYRNALVPHGRGQTRSRRHWPHPGTRPLRFTRKGSKCSAELDRASLSQATRGARAPRRLPCRRRGRPT